MLSTRWPRLPARLQRNNHEASAKFTAEVIN
jgi:hypothetical protein